jgi:hypothetical protein
VPNTPAASSRAGAAARQAIDSIGQTFDLTKGIDADQATAAAQRAVSVIRGLMTSLTSAEDSTWASIKLSDALLLTGDDHGACDALHQAQRLASSPPQKRAIAIRAEGPLKSCQ